jgi:hypothetical protein
VKINANETKRPIWIRIVSVAVLLISVNAGKYDMQKQDFQNHTKSFPFINYSLNQTHTNYRMEYTMYREKLRPEKCNPQEILTSKTSCNFASLNYIESLIPGLLLTFRMMVTKWTQVLFTYTPLGTRTEIL